MKTDQKLIPIVTPTNVVLAKLLNDLKRIFSQLPFVFPLKNPPLNFFIYFDKEYYDNKSVNNTL